MESAPDNALDYSDSRLASTFATRVYMYAKVSMGLTVSCQKRSVIFHRQPSKMPTGINCQKVSRHFKSCFFLVFQLIFMDLWLLGTISKPENQFPRSQNTPSRHYNTLVLAYIWKYLEILQVKGQDNLQTTTVNINLYRSKYVQKLLD